MNREGLAAVRWVRRERAMTTPTRRALVVALIAWFAVSVLSAVQSSLRQGSRTWDELLAGTLLAWLPWLLLAFPVYQLNGASRRRRRRRWITLHLLTAVGGSALYLGYLALFRSLPHPASVSSWRDGYREVAGEHLLGALLIYGVLATSTLLLRRRGEAQVRNPSTVPGVTVRQHGATRIVAAKTIDWVAAEGSYARLYCGAETSLVRRPLSRLAAELSEHGFVRVHRSALINLDRLREVESIGHGDGTLILDDGSRVRLSRTYRKALDAALAER